MNNQHRKDQNKSIELSLAPKNTDPSHNTEFKAEYVKINDLGRILRSNNYSPIIWKDGQRNSNNFNHATGFVIDIDKGLTINDAETRLKKRNLNYTIIPSKRHTPENHRFHIMLRFNYPVYTAATYKKITEHIAAKLFPEIDESTLDTARFLFGSPDNAKTTSFHNGNDFDILEFGEIWDDTLEVVDSQGNKANISKFKTKTSILCPFHNDNNHSAFIEYSEKWDNWFIRCSACSQTFWKYKHPQTLSEQCNPYWSYGTEVYEFPSISRGMDPKIQEKLVNRLGHYIRTELKAIYDSIGTGGYRYSIRVPITDEEKALFRDNVTDVEADADLLIQRIIEKSPENGWEDYIKFINNGWLPTSFLHQFNSLHNNYNRIIKNLRKRKLIKGEQQRKQISDSRQYCYKMTEKLTRIIKDGQKSARKYSV